MKLGHTSYLIYYYFTHLKSKSQNYLLKNVKYATRKHSYRSLYHDKINDIIFAHIYFTLIELYKNKLDLVFLCLV